ncbi:nitrous oxide reductase family maturation protein NosD [Ketobacter alkanivorans]|uniref:Copper-binding protein n=1 Tax=Ketobacter alkanivorans TaxID=1917421 RepID=A0A2K9LJL7_9GAMM|nr:nitrous oxide reductase family maturation protein NosD [Ketobacter alkanivorans]AUM12453.1 copper-binding protein [Ketobacter alkanivorans]
MHRVALASLLLLLCSYAVQGKTVTDSATLQRALEQSTSHIELSPGTYRGNFTIQSATSLHCQSGAILDGAGQADTLRIKAEGVTVSGCRIVGWGDNLTAMNAGIFVEKQAHKVRLEHNQLEGDTFGIWVDGSRDAHIYHNRIQGNERIRSQDRGNGIHLFSTTGADVAHNEVWHTRDGIYIDTSNHNRLHNNYLHHLRYGIHYMYSYHNEVSNNRTHSTRTGYALMQSKHLHVFGNRSEQDENYGILMNFITDSNLHNNIIINVQTGSNPTGSAHIQGAEGKALFIYNSVFNTIAFNRLQGSDLGIHLTAGSEDNQIHNNAFIHNKQQVKYVSNRMQEWSYQERGNYWSDYLGWDRNRDGVGDTHYEPNDAMDKVLWTYPTARLLINSPAVETLRWIQKAFPVLKPAGVQDSYPLMQPPADLQTINAPPAVTLSPHYGDHP